MKIAVVPDIHGSHIWESIVSIEKRYDKIIFLGDYMDTWENIWPDQLENLKSILKFKKDYKDKVCLCLGNHDTSYILDEQCSGYQPHHAIDIKEFFSKNKKYFEIVFIFDKYIFSHAGVSEKWLKPSTLNSPEEINQLYKEKPDFFRFIGPNCFGDNLAEGPLWIRPRSLTQTSIRGYIQVVGHTETGNNPQELKTMWKDKVILIDSSKHDKIIEINTTSHKWNIIDFSKK